MAKNGRSASLTITPVPQPTPPRKLRLLLDLEGAQAAAMMIVLANVPLIKELQFIPDEVFPYEVMEQIGRNGAGGLSTDIQNNAVLEKRVREFVEELKGKGIEIR